jgi:predicted small metal-binding protein
MKLACAKMGNEGCDFVAEGETADDVMMKAMQHGMEAHGMTEADMTPELKEQAMGMMEE